MSKYTTGEIARLCGVSVRTVQYYDTRGILIPSELSEGGRRLYSEPDLNRMKIICFLREIGMPINRISEILSESNSDKVISLLLEEQEKELKSELQEKKTKLRMLEGLRKELKSIGGFSVESIGDVAHIMESKKKLFRLRAFLIGAGIVMEAIEIGTAVLWATTGIWWPFVVGMAVILGLSIGISAVYFKKVAYICPECHSVFQPKFKEAFFAYHTPKTRRLTCPECNHKGLCVETYNAVPKINE